MTDTCTEFMTDGQKDSVITQDLVDQLREHIEEYFSVKGSSEEDGRSPDAILAATCRNLTDSAVVSMILSERWVGFSAVTDDDLWYQVPFKDVTCVVGGVQTSRDMIKSVTRNMVRVCAQAADSHTVGGRFVRRSEVAAYTWCLGAREKQRVLNLTSRPYMSVVAERFLRQQLNDFGANSPYPAIRTALVHINRHNGVFTEPTPAEDESAAGGTKSDLTPTELDFVEALQNPEHHYHELAKALVAGYAHSAEGKGKERHGHGLRWTDQRMFTVNRAIGTSHGLVYQVGKKSAESVHMQQDAALRELSGAMVYVAAAYEFRKDHDA